MIYRCFDPRYICPLPAFVVIGVLITRMVVLGGALRGRVRMGEERIYE